ncbi:MAG: macro domain-containing protein [Spirochaetales bacterium]
MTTPELSIRPIRQGFALEGVRTLDLLATVQVAKPDHPEERSPVSLALVLDRSGSMQGNKIAFARAGASAAIGQLGKDDRVSLTIFDNQVEVLQDLIAAKDASALHAKIALIEARANTDLQGGWAAGAATLAGSSEANRPRRVVLLTDGLANEGVTDSGAIAAAVAEAAHRGVATSAMGIGEDYNEDLLETISRAGDGSYYYVEEADQLPGLFEAELRGFKAVVGRQVTLSIFPSPGIELVGILNDFPVSQAGTPVLPNLVAGARQTIGFSLRALSSFAGKPGDDLEACVFQLAWSDPESGERREARLSVRLPVVSVASFDALPADPVAAEALALLRSARAKREAMTSVDAQDEAAIRAALARARGFLGGLADSPALEKENASLDSLEKDLVEGRLARLRKNAHFEAYSRSQAMDEGRFDGHINRKVIMIAARSMVVTTGDLARISADAIVSSWSAGTGLDGHLRAEGGVAYRAECEALGSLTPGQVSATGGGALAAAAVLHANVPNGTGNRKNDGDQLAAVYRNCFRLAKDRGLLHLAVPLLGAGGRGYPLEVAAQVAVVCAATYLFQEGLKPKVSFICQDPKAVAALESMLSFGYVGV